MEPSWGFQMVSLKYIPHARVISHGGLFGRPMDLAALWLAALRSCPARARACEADPRGAQSSDRAPVGYALSETMKFVATGNTYSWLVDEIVCTAGT
jgi:hypothetical protein